MRLLETATRQQGNRQRAKATGQRAASQGTEARRHGGNSRRVASWKRCAHGRSMRCVGAKYRKHGRIAADWRNSLAVSEEWRGEC